MVRRDCQDSVNPLGRGDPASNRKAHILELILAMHAHFSCSEMSRRLLKWMKRVQCALHAIHFRFVTGHNNLVGSMVPVTKQGPIPSTLP